MNLLIKELPLQVLPSLAMQVGLNAAILLQQLHFRSLISTNVRDGHKWVYKTYEEWKNEEFPFWSVDTIKRAIRRLEDSGYIISTSSYNQMKMDKTKWYRIDYTILHCQGGQDAPSTTAKSFQEEVQIAPTTEGKMPLAITKEIKSIKKELVENDLDVVSVIDYLNDKTCKQFKASSKATARLVNGRFSEGYTAADCKMVIDTKVNDWLDDPHWQKYLRPSTLFNATNFENYLEESRPSDLPESRPPKPFELDFNQGEA
ncbi:conserved phage C-terminal domain-containing protein [Sporosarcina sp. E16_8]|uniref:conserved phage C-terminal domain-containing protein n=1 Tax=Sporosarcina sp. E16_8 TaxID=2789295 RepID=UPI001A9232E4|nr:conserved phage C-terminal domain-containing protein [Sporosarcina sp. E16_8]MBO0589064.1 conserved phage C-terminal domain-containing protein [Sporosarcina sp. E16_8]